MFAKNNCFFPNGDYYSEKCYLYAKFAHMRASPITMALITLKKNKGLIEHIFRYMPLLLAVIFWCLLVFKEQYFLKKVEDLSAFLFDKQFIMEALRIPGGFLGLAGSFFTQFLHIPWLGALLWVFLLLIAYQLTVRIFRIPEGLHPIALIPVALIIIGNLSLGYGVFIMREQDHFFAPLLGFLASLIPLALFPHFKSVWAKIVFLILWTFAGYALLGVFAFTGASAAACAFLVQHDHKRSERLSVFSSAIALIIIVPLVIYSAYTTYNLTESWHLGLPSISEDSWTRAMRAPFQLALLCQILLALFSGLMNSQPLAARWKLPIQSITYLTVIVFVWGFWFKDENFHTELAMSEAVDRFDWDRTIEIFQKAVKTHSKSDAKVYSSRSKIIETARSIDQINEIVEEYKDRFFEPTRTMVLYRDLALLKTNRALDEAFSMKDGSCKQESRTQIPMAYQSGCQLYFQFGLPNLCYRWCLENAVEYGWSNNTIKYMTLLAILTSQEDLADKFLRQLDKTLFSRKWADQMRLLAQKPEATLTEKPFNTIVPLMCYQDNMTNDMGKTEMFLIKHFSNKRPQNATPEYDKTALFWAMRTQNISAFWEKLYYYIESIEPNKIPLNVQEAALLYSSLEKEEFKLSYDDKVIDSYDAFLKYVDSHKIRNIQEASYPYSLKFGRTFYYFYYFVRGLKTY